MPQPEIPVIPQDEEDARAIQALAKGVASEGQQQRAFRCIVYELAGTYDQSFNLDPYLTAFNEGRRRVGRSIVAIGNANLTALYATKRRKHHGG